MEPAIALMMEQIMYKADRSLLDARPNDDSDTNEPHDMQLPRLVAMNALCVSVNSAPNKNKHLQEV